MRELEFPYHPHVTGSRTTSPMSILDQAFEGLASFDCEFVRGPVLALRVHEESTGWVPTRDFVLAAAHDG